MNGFLPALSRRHLAGLLLAVPSLVLLARPPRAALAACGSPTATQPPGPHYKANAPLRTTLAEKGAAGTRLVLTGRVLDHNCRSVLGALLDFWQADATGLYDDKGFTLRGRQTTDTQGRYRVETIVPGIETGRARAIHVKLAAAGGRILTTRLYFPDDPGNAADPLFRPELALKITDTPEGMTAAFDFILPPP